MVKRIKKRRVKAKDAKKDWSDLTALIRSIQRAQGDPDCFGRPPSDCDQLDCEWRKYCLEELKKDCPDGPGSQGEANRPASKGSRSEGKNP
jgi:hypothetical protein